LGPPTRLRTGFGGEAGIVGLRADLSRRSDLDVSADPFDPLLSIRVYEGEMMFTYHQIKAIQENRYPIGEGRHRPSAHRRHVSLPRLLTALAGNLARLGVREGKGKTRPASPAY
jgi:hypothetical protein